MKNLCFLLIIMLPFGAQAETAKCEHHFSKGKELVNKGEFQSAITEYFKVLECDRRLAPRVQDSIKVLFSKLSRQKEELKEKLSEQKDLISALFGNTEESLVWTLGPNGKYGVFNQNEGVDTAGYIWDQPQPFHHGVARAKKGGEWFFVNSKGQSTTTTGFDFIHPSSKDYYLAIQMTQDYPREVVLDASGTPKSRVRMLKKGFPKADDKVFPFGDENKWGLMDTQGREQGDAVYDSVAKVYEGFARVKKNNRWGFINKQGEIVPKWGSIQYDEASDFAGGIAWVRKGRDYYLIVLSENKRMSKPASSLMELYERYFAAVNDDGEGEFSEKQFDRTPPPITVEEPKILFDEKGLQIIEKEGDTKNIALFRRNDRYQLFAKNGDSLSQAFDKIYQQIDSTELLVYVTQQRAHYGLLVYQIDKSGLPQELEYLKLSNDYEDLGDYQPQKNCIRIKQNGKWGFIVWKDETKHIIPCNYDLVSDFFYHKEIGQDVARVYVAAYNLYFYIDKDGKLLNTIERDKIW